MTPVDEIAVEVLKPADEQLADEQGVDEAIVAAFARLIPLLSSSAPIPDAQRLARVLSHPANTVFAARTVSDGRILGVLTLVAVELPTGMEARIEDVVVDESARGLGLGRALVTAALAAAAAAGARYVDLTSAPHRVSARALYQGVGFEARETGVFRHELADYRR